MAMLWAREMGVTYTQDVTGRQLPLVTAPASELGVRPLDFGKGKVGAMRLWGSLYHTA